MLLDMERGGGLFDFAEHGNQKWLPYALLLSVTFALYGMTLYFQFVSDDTQYVIENYRSQGLDWGRLKDIWTFSYLGHYAPLHNTLLAALYVLSGLNPFGFHLGQLLLHAACVCLLYFVLTKMEAPRVGLLAALLFAVHPTNIETVAWVSETKSTLAFLLFLFSLWFFVRQRQRGGWADGILCAAFLILSLLAKINTVVAPAIFLLYDYRESGSLRKMKWRSLGAFFLISVLATAMHVAVYHQSAQGLESAYYISPWIHLLNLPFYLIFYVQMAVVPYPVSFAHSFALHLGWSWETAAGWAALLALGWVTVRSSRAVQFWTLWFVIFLAPVLQLIPNPVWVADRYLYIPLVGSSVLLSRLFFWLKDRLTAPVPRWSCEAGMAAVLFAYAAYTNHHLPVWRNDLAIWQDAIRWCEGSAFCHYNLGESLLAQWQLQRGGDELIKAVRLEPAPVYFTALGDALTLNAHEYHDAMDMYRSALTRTAGMSRSAISDIYARLSRTCVRAGRMEDAVRAIQAAKELDRTNPRIWAVDSFVEWRQGNLEAARASLRRFLLMTGRPEVSTILTYYWGDAGDVGEMLTGLRAAQAPAAATAVAAAPQAQGE